MSDGTPSSPPAADAPVGEPSRSGSLGGRPWLVWSLVGAIALVVVYYFGFHQLYFSRYGATAFRWLWMNWNPINDYEHGKFIPLAALALVFIKRRQLAAAPVKPEWWGLLLVAFGILLYLASARALQPRLALGGLPFIILGAAVYVRGREFARILLFPSFLIYFGIPVPGMMQATNNLQLIASAGAYRIASLLGVEAIVRGNEIMSASDSWGFDVAEGCSGIRSLMALTLIAALYAHLVHKSLWKKVVLFLSAFPLAIVANIFRVASIIIIAEYGNAEFAGDLYHDYSGFIFFPIGLAGLVLVSKLLDFSQHFSQRTVRVIQRRGAEPAPTTPHG